MPHVTSARSSGNVSPSIAAEPRRDAVAFMGAFRALDLTEEALAGGLLSAAGITLAACLSYASEIGAGALRSMLLAEWARLFGAWAIETARSSLA